jgi:hypothetical protein
MKNGTGPSEPSIRASLDVSRNETTLDSTRPIWACEQIRRMKGGSQSHLMRCSDGHYYVVKFPNPQGTKILFNDLFGTRLAGLLGLPVAVSRVVYVGPELVKYTPDLVFELPRSHVPCQAGLCFGSRFPVSPKNARFSFFPGLGEIENASDFRGMLVFDKWTCNADGREVVFFQTRTACKWHALMVDQGFCFNADQWNFPDGDARLWARFYHLDVYRSVTGIESFDPWLTRLDEIDENMIAEAVRGIPPEWHGETEAVVGSLIEQLERRRSRVRQLLWSMQRSYKFYKSRDIFPNWPPSVSTQAACAWAGD